MSGIPRAIASDEIRKLLSSIDRSHAKGRRDYAILLLLARLGLRSGEITHLDLDDIDWNSGSLKVRGKGRDSRLPLPQDVGEAIVAYLQTWPPDYDKPASIFAQQSSFSRFSRLNRDRWHCPVCH